MAEPGRYPSRQTPPSSVDFPRNSGKLPSPVRPGQGETVRRSKGGSMDWNFWMDWKLWVEALTVGVIVVVINSALSKLEGIASDLAALRKQNDEVLTRLKDIRSVLE